MKKRVAPVLAFTLICAAAALWWGGCDFAAVDEGADVPLEELLTSVSGAQTQADAEKQIRRLLNKAEVGVTWRSGKEAGPFDAYTLDDDLLAALAQAQAEYNTGGGKNAGTFGEAYQSVLAANERAAEIGQETVFDTPVRSITATVEEVLTSLEILAGAALEAPEKPQNAMLLAIVARGAQVPGEVPDLSATDRISPVQKFLASIWMHKYGPSMPLFSEGDEGLDPGKIQTGGGGNQDCPNGTYLIAKIDNWSETSNNKTVNGVHAWGPGSTANWTSVISISAIVVKGSTSNHTYLLPGGAKSGVVTNEFLRTKSGKKPAISNIKFCGGFQSCVDIAQAAYQACIACSPDSKLCEKLYKFLVNKCHDQGLMK